MERAAKLDLKDVTLCAADTANRPLAARSLHASMEHCDFAAAVLFSDRDPGGRFATERIEPLRSRADYSRFILKELHARTATAFVLVTQWDGFVVDPAAWQPEFRDCDYIGARWAWHDAAASVGNGGFSLRSRKLLAALAQPRFAVPEGAAEDELICRVFRPALESEFGVRFAPPALADRFAYERTLPARPTFGFHGLFNLWRHVDDEDMVAIAEEFGPYLLQTREYLELLAQYYAMRKFVPLRALYARLRATGIQPAEVQRQMDALVRNPSFFAGFAETCEALRPDPQPA